MPSRARRDRRPLLGLHSRRKVLCTGDFVIWAAPNAGNPQKAQRYAREWAEALRAMAKTGAEVLLPGHGIPFSVRSACGRCSTTPPSICKATTRP